MENTYDIRKVLFTRLNLIKNGEKVEDEKDFLERVIKQTNKF